MAKYVDIDEVMDEAPLRMEDDKDDKPVDKCFNAGWNTASSEFMKSINELPTINVVRCKDCIHADMSGYCPVVQDRPPADFFCRSGRAEL